jgi:hypothetical protein
MTEFIVAGPYAVPCQKLPGGWVIPTDLNAFWNGASACADCRGCYIFCYTWGGKHTPIYVGKAARQALRNEAFNVFQRATHYAPSMAKYERGEFVMFFIYAPNNGAGRPPEAKIGELEEELIEYAYLVNNELSNTKGIPDFGYTIRGVLRSRSGKPSDSALALRTMLAIQ